MVWQGVIVPNLSANDSLDLTEVHWVLIIEKEVSLMLQTIFYYR